jgi:hypothetical protein
VGLLLFIVSFAVPTTDLRGFGLSAFIMAAQSVYGMLAEGEVFRSWDSARFAFALGFGWIANFSALFRLPLLVAAAMITAPWVLFSAFLFFHPEKPELWVLSFLPFYPWAFGIGLINYARILELCKGGAAEVSQTTGRSVSRG